MPEKKDNIRKRECFDFIALKRQGFRWETKKEPTGAGQP